MVYILLVVIEPLFLLSFLNATTTFKSFYVCCKNCILWTRICGYGLCPGSDDFYLFLGLTFSLCF